MNTIDRLRMGLERVKRGWCQGWYARDANGKEVGSLSVSARRWCCVGSLSHLGCEDTTAFERLCQTAGQVSIADWNDTPGRTQAEVIALFERAIAAEESKQ